MGVTLAACLLPVVSYMGWYKVEHGKPRSPRATDLPVRPVYKFADCHRMKGLPVREYPLCTSREPAAQLAGRHLERAVPAEPLHRHALGPENNAQQRPPSARSSPARRHLRVVAHDFFRVFR